MFIFWDLSPKWIYSTLQVFYFSILCENGCFVIWLAHVPVPVRTSSNNHSCQTALRQEPEHESLDRFYRENEAGSRYLFHGRCIMGYISFNYSIINSVDWVEHLFLLAFPSCGSMVLQLHFTIDIGVVSRPTEVITMVHPNYSFIKHALVLQFWW